MTYPSRIRILFFGLPRMAVSISYFSDFLVLPYPYPILFVVSRIAVSVSYRVCMVYQYPCFIACRSIVTRWSLSWTSNGSQCWSCCQFQPSPCTQYAQLFFLFAQGNSFDGQLGKNAEDKIADSEAVKHVLEMLFWNGNPSDLKHLSTLTKK